MSDTRNELAKRLALGEDTPTCAKALDLTYEQLKELLSDPELPHLVASFIPPEPDLRQRFLNETARNIEVLKELRDRGDDDRVRLKAVTELLDRAGFTPIRRIQELRVTLAADRKDLLTKTLKELNG